MAVAVLNHLAGILVTIGWCTWLWLVTIGWCIWLWLVTVGWCIWLWLVTRLVYMAVAVLNHLAGVLVTIGWCIWL